MGQAVRASCGFLESGSARALARLGRGTRCLAALLGCSLSCACGASLPDARYPARAQGCAVLTYPAQPSVAVDQLGAVKVDCRPEGGRSCERQLLDAVCARGGDVAWGMADNALNSATLVAHAAHSKRATQGPRAEGCAVQVFIEAPPMRTENIGPVTALCDPDDARDVCLRALEDQVCRLGGDVVWQVDGPTPVDTSNGPRQRMRGRAAHTK